MRSFKLFVISLLLVNISCKAQEMNSLDNGGFIAYATDDYRYFIIEIKDSIASVTYSDDPLGGYQEDYRISRLNDSILKLDLKNKKGKSLDYDELYNLHDKQIKIRDKNHSVIKEINYPFYRKSYIDSITGSDGSQPIFIINGKIIKSTEAEEYQSKYLNKLKKKDIEIKALKSKEAFDKYGELSLYGVVEIIHKIR